MSFGPFSNTISRFLSPLAPLPDFTVLATLDPTRIYVETVRSLLGVTTKHAARICDTAVRQGVFTQAVEVLAKDGSVAAEAAREEDLPARVWCSTEIDGHPEEHEVETTHLPRRTFYRMVTP